MKTSSKMTSTLNSQLNVSTLHYHDNTMTKDDDTMMKDDTMTKDDNTMMKDDDDTKETSQSCLSPPLSTGAKKGKNKRGKARSSHYFLLQSLPMSLSSSSATCCLKQSSHRTPRHYHSQQPCQLCV